MKRLFSLLTAFALAAALCAPVMADDVTTPDVTAPTPTPTAAIDTTSSDGVYVSAYSVTDTAGGEVTTVQVGDKINIVLKVVDHASARYCVKPEEISARINSAVFTYTGTCTMVSLPFGRFFRVVRLYFVVQSRSARRRPHHMIRPVNSHGVMPSSQTICQTVSGVPPMRRSASPMAVPMQ